MSEASTQIEILGAATPPPDRDRADQLDDEVWAMAYIVAEIMNGADPSAVVNDLPPDVRRRVIAVRHRSSALRMLPPRDQYGPLPTPPPRARVMRERVRTVDADDSPHASPGRASLTS